MIRLTRKVFTDLAIWMIGLGLVMGLVFPFFVGMMGVPAELALTPWFFAATMTAGCMVGGANIWLTKSVVGIRLRTLADRMRFVETNLRTFAQTGNAEKCTVDACHVDVDSEDEIGESAKAFNYLVESLAYSHRTDAAVRSFTEVLSSHLELDVLSSKALEQLLEHSEAAAGAILITEEGELKIASSQGIRTPDSLCKSDHVRRAIQTASRVTVNLPQDVTVEGILTNFRPREVLVDPVFYKEVPLGAIVLASGAGFKDDAKSRLDLFRHGLALAFNNALTHDRLQTLAALDPLTGIYNRRFGMARLHEEFGRAIRMTGTLGVMMLDIDHFKKVNDTYGHLAGDRVLVHVAKTTRAALREGDVLMRYGGEEFLVILPAASKANSHDLGERIRRMVEDSSVAEGDQMICVTISIGITSFPELAAASDQELVKRADEALYSAKESGRNRVIVG
ncbi:GGDEF domain-containing protein [Rhodoferax sp.]|uniref:GGDEF domain-containing protein n=1 Tax=Rhodoferax sp. TaxID=50421 RepID=UPI0026346EE0|nr:GGDEF domain-containing protein [Rhodoferax sp.]MDD2917879.1 GGDEF domain-containing protein [Rhodoferax sp.]